MLTGRKALHALLGASLVAACLAITAPAHAVDKPCASTAPAPSPSATKFLITGDSIVHESRGDWTWRYFLWKQLVAAGVSTDFVGDYNWLIDPNTSSWPFCDYVDLGFDLDHTGYPGRKITDFNAVGSATNGKPWIQYEVEQYDADVVVAIIGANDLAAQGGTAQATLNAMQTYVANIRAGNPNAKIVLATAPTGGPYDGKPNAAYNTMLANAVPTWSTVQSPIALAQVMSNWGTATNTWDQIHPNVVGEQLIAEGLADALQTLGIGTAGVGVSPDYKMGLRNPVTNFTATLNGSAVDLTWTLPVGSSGVYVVARDTTGGTVGEWQNVKNVDWVPFGYLYNIGTCQGEIGNDKPCTSYKLTSGLIAGHSYDLALHADKGTAVAVDLFSNIQSVTMPPATPPATPTVSTPTPGPGSVSLSWAAAAGANQPYNVRYELAGSGTFTTTTAAGTSKTISGLTPGQSYGFQVQAVKDGVTSDWSTEQFATPQQLPLAKPVVTPVAGVHAVTVSWPAVSTANQPYKVRWHVVGSSTYGSTTSPGTSRAISGLVAGTKYGFQVAAVRDGVQGPWSDEKVGIPKATTIGALAKPVLKQVAGPKVKVTWKKAVGATRYLVQFHQVGKPWRNVGWFTALTTTSGKLAKKKAYEWRVVPYDGNVAGRVSPTARITVK